MENLKAPKLFISYSQSNPEHEQWVLNLATQLRESGVDVIFDKWDLRAGHDVVKYMEKMVTDPDIKKVAIICDKTYAEKADGRTGGVGTETQIVSKEIYENQEQEKFVAVIAEKNEAGRPYLPAYYKSRIYIDLSELDEYNNGFEQLLRWIFGEPLHQKPELGPKPPFLGEKGSILLGTTTYFKRAIGAVRDGESYATGALGEYFDTFAKNLERFRIKETGDDPYTTVAKSIKDFLPYRNEAIKIFIAISQYAVNDENMQAIFKFLEKLASYISMDSSMKDDNFNFIVHELFLYVVAILIKHEHFDQVNFLLEQDYYIQGNYDQNAIENFTVFRKYLCSFDSHDNKLKQNPGFTRAILLKERSSETGLEFLDLVQADIVLLIRRAIENLKMGYPINKPIWWPETAACLNFYGTFEIFAKAVSSKYFDRIKYLLAIDSLSDLQDLKQTYESSPERLYINNVAFDFFEYIGLDRLATRP